MASSSDTHGRAAAATQDNAEPHSPPTRPLWDQLISLAPGGASLLQSWRWGRFKQESSRWKPVRLAFPAEKPAICAQMLVRRVPRLPLPVSVAYVPRGPVLLSNVDDDTERAFWALAKRAARRRGAIFLKVEPPIHLNDSLSRSDVDRRMGALGFVPAGRLQPSRTIVLDLKQGEDAILKGMKPKTRYNLRLAGRRGVEVRRAATLQDLAVFHSMLEVTGERDEFGIHTLSYYEQLWQIFGPPGDDSMIVLLAEHPEAAERALGPVAGLVAFRFGREAIYMYGASENRGREHMPNYLLQWEAIRWAISSGCDIYDFWGIPDAPAEDDDSAESTAAAVNARQGLRGVYWFKKGFGGREVEYPGAYDYVYRPLLYRLWMRWRGANLG